MMDNPAVRAYKNLKVPRSNTTTKDTKKSSGLLSRSTMPNKEKSNTQDEPLVRIGRYVSQIRSQRKRYKDG
jgi:hypothetical protein